MKRSVEAGTLQILKISSPLITHVESTSLGPLYIRRTRSAFRILMNVRDNLIRRIRAADDATRTSGLSARYFNVADLKFCYFNLTVIQLRLSAISERRRDLLARLWGGGAPGSFFGAERS